MGRVKSKAVEKGARFDDVSFESYWDSYGASVRDCRSKCVYSMRDTKEAEVIE